MIPRLLKHLLTPSWLSRRDVPLAMLARIESAVAASESAHRGEIRVAAEGALDVMPLLRGQTPRQRAIELFAQLRVWDTVENSGVLVYLQLVDHAVEIVADRGINACVPQQEWDAICARMSAAFRERRFEHGVLNGLNEITALLMRHFPARADNPNELPDKPDLL